MSPARMRATVPRTSKPIGSDATVETSSTRIWETVRRRIGLSALALRPRARRTFGARPVCVSSATSRSVPPLGRRAQSAGGAEVGPSSRRAGSFLKLKFQRFEQLFWREKRHSFLRKL
eukprot:scaffold735_cov255-Pinguiococcus_pyrenoidosus.AAC.35